MKRLAVLLLVLCALESAGCGSAPAERTPTPRPATLTPRPAATQTSAPTATSEPVATPSGPVPIGTMMDPDITVEVTHATGIKVDSMHLGPNDGLFFIDHHGDTIYQLLRDGRLVEHERFQGYKMDHFNVAPDGTFWFNNNLDWTLYRVPKDGQPLAVAQRTNRTFCFDSQGNLFAVESDADGVQRISEEGVIEVVASDLQGQSIIAGPDDALYLVTEKGELVRLGTDGAREVIATGLDREDHPAFHPNGQIYLFGWENGLSRVDAATGEV